MAQEGCENKMWSQGGKMRMFLPRRFRFGGDIFMLNISKSLEKQYFLEIFLKFFLNIIAWLILFLPSTLSGNYSGAAFN